MTRRPASILPALCTAFATALLLASAAPAGDLAVRVIDRSPDVRNLDTTDTLKWYADESIDYTVRPRRAGVPVAIPGDAVATWIIADAATGTNYLSAVAASQTSNSVTFHLPLGGAALPEGVEEWASFVTLHQGTNFLGVIDRCRAECLWSPYTSAAALTPTNPLPELLRQFATTSYVAAAIEYAITNLPPAGIDFPIVTNASFTNFAFPRGITLETADIPDITQQGLPSFNYSGLAAYYYANSTWAGLFGYPCVGIFGLHGNFQVNMSGPYVVGGLGFAGTEKRLDISDGELTFGGEPVSGIHNLEAGANIAVSTNTKTAVVTIATTDDVSFANVAVAGNLTLANEQIDSWDDIAYTRQTTIYATNWYTVETNTYNYTTNIYNAPISNTYYTTQVTYTNCTITNIHYHTTVSNSFRADTLYTSNYYADRVVQPMFWLTNGVISLQPDVSIYAATPESGTIFEVDLSALDDPQNCAITFEMLLDLGAATSNVTIMSTNTLSWLEGDAPAIPQGARSILVFRSYDMTNWIGNLQGILP